MLLQYGQKESIFLIFGFLFFLFGIVSVFVCVGSTSMEICEGSRYSVIDAKSGI